MRASACRVAPPISKFAAVYTNDASRPKAYSRVHSSQAVDVFSKIGDFILEHCHRIPAGNSPGLRLLPIDCVVGRLGLSFVLCHCRKPDHILDPVVLSKEE